VEEFSFPEKETNGFSGEAASCKIIRVTFWRMAFLKKYAVLFGITRLFLKGKDKAARRAQFPRRARTKLRSSYKVHATLRQTPRVTGFPIMTPGFFNVIPPVHTMILSRDSGNHGARGRVRTAAVSNLLYLGAYRKNHCVSHGRGLPIRVLRWPPEAEQNK
jgi:hypothetical protein